jgi:putative tryptophan/tyrosine transport system substrate-binding protein
MQSSQLKRRKFLTLIGGATAWPLAVRAQQGERMRRIGVLMGNDESHAETRLWLSGFVQALQELGWVDGRNVQIVVRWTAGDSERMQSFAKELTGLKPDVIVAQNSPVTAALQRQTQAIPIVFVIVSDPVGQRFVTSLARPGGNITGFVFIEGAMGGKWLELLTEIAPGVKRVVAMFNPGTAPLGGAYVLPSFEAAARSTKVEAITAPVHSDAEIERAITALAGEPGAGLIVMPDPFMVVHRATIIAQAVRSSVPTVYNAPYFVRGGGLLSYGPDEADIFRRAAPYVDRILRGAKPAELPVQLPVKFEMYVNSRTAKMLGLTVPPSILLRADEIIE